MEMSEQSRMKKARAHACEAMRRSCVNAQSCAFLPRFAIITPPLKVLRDKIYLAFFRTLIERARGEFFNSLKFTIKGELWIGILFV